ncbi:MAG: YceD family protein [Gemmatimonadaceae bacterium]
MLYFDLRSLESKAVHVDASLAPNDPIWEEGDFRPSEPIRVTGRLSSAGEGRFYFSGRIEGRLALPCRLCLDDVDVDVDEEVHFILAETGAEEADDPDVFLYDPNERNIDLRGAVRETWLLTAPAYAQCREDCKGLCAICGTNLNESTCNCTPTTTDSRWDALLKHQGDAH